MLTLKKFTKMRDDAMMIRVGVKTTRMYANGLIHQRQLPKQWQLISFLF